MYLIITCNFQTANIQHNSQNLRIFAVLIAEKRKIEE